MSRKDRIRDILRQAGRPLSANKIEIGGNHDCCFTDYRRGDAIDILYNVDGLHYSEDTLGKIPIY